MAKEQLTINLLENKSKGVVERFLDWSLAIGRLLIIITETVALAAFLYRFSIDRRLIDLSDEIKKNQAIVTYFQDGEITFRKMQQKLLVSKTNNTATANTVTLFKDMVRLAQDEVTFTNLSVEANEMEVSVQAGSVTILSSFVEKLQRHPLIASVSIDKIENRTSNAVIVVSITAKIKGVAPAAAQTAPQQQTNIGL